MVEIGDLGEPGIPRLFRLGVQRHRRIRDVVQDRFHGGMKQRKPVLHAAMLAPGADRLVQRVLVQHDAEQLAIAGAEPRDRLLVQKNLGHRLQRDTVALLRRPLAHRVEGPHALQLIAEQVQPQRLLGPRREQVDDAAANGELARLAHGLRPRIAVVGQIGLQLVQVDPVADLGAERRVAKAPRGGTF